jgi:uncharacterized membrane protein YdcZ (DUF606 family)
MKTIIAIIMAQLFPNWVTDHFRSLAARVENASWYTLNPMNIKNIT